MKINIINHTKESKDLLRKLTKVVSRHCGISDNIEIIFWTGQRVHGRAYVGSVISYNSPRRIRKDNFGWHKSLSMWLPDTWKTEKLITVLQVFHHEFDHTRGLNHKDMLDINKIVISEQELNEVRMLLNNAVLC